MGRPSVEAVVLRIILTGVGGTLILFGCDRLDTLASTEAAAHLASTEAAARFPTSSVRVLEVPAPGFGGLPCERPLYFLSELEPLHPGYGRDAEPLLEELLRQRFPIRNAWNPTSEVLCMQAFLWAPLVVELSRPDDRMLELGFVYSVTTPFPGCERIRCVNSILYYAFSTK